MPVHHHGHLLDQGDRSEGRGWLDRVDSEDASDSQEERAGRKRPDWGGKPGGDRRLSWAPLSESTRWTCLLFTLVTLAKGVGQKVVRVNQRGWWVDGRLTVVQSAMLLGDLTKAFSEEQTQSDYLEKRMVRIVAGSVYRNSVQVEKTEGLKVSMSSRLEEDYTGLRSKVGW